MKIFAILLNMIGLGLILTGIFFGFDGKYGWNSFVTSFSEFHLGTPNALLTLGSPGVILMSIGIKLFCKKKNDS